MLPRRRPRRALPLHLGLAVGLGQPELDISPPHRRAEAGLRRDGAAGGEWGLRAAVGRIGEESGVRYARRPGAIRGGRVLRGGRHGVAQVQSRYGRRGVSATDVADDGSFRRRQSQQHRSVLSRVGRRVPRGRGQDVDPPRRLRARLRRAVGAHGGAQGVPDRGAARHLHVSGLGALRAFRRVGRPVHAPGGAGRRLVSCAQVAADRRDGLQLGRVHHHLARPHRAGIRARYHRHHRAGRGLHQPNYRDLPRPPHHRKERHQETRTLQHLPLVDRPALPHPRHDQHPPRPLPHLRAHRRLGLLHRILRLRPLHVRLRRGHAASGAGKAQPPHVRGARRQPPRRRRRRRGQRGRRRERHGGGAARRLGARGVARAG
mmetsp:Transcript_14893/g.38018  ORF Transcript_14893/g.38018 Transcript_14893/m.38018 type:complete len:375 (+) Transcript_14893:334-1458(+)